MKNQTKKMNNSSFKTFPRLSIFLTAIVLSMLLIVSGCGNPAKSSGGGSSALDDVVFIKITPPAAGIVGQEPTPGSTVGKLGDDGKGVFIAGRTVKLSPYHIAEKEVTYKLWKEVLTWAEGNGYVFENKGESSSSSEEFPVESLTWKDLIVWCNACTEKKNGNTNECVYRNAVDRETVLKSVSASGNPHFDITKKGYRLPTEAEWEYAARWQGDNSTNAQKYGDVWLTKLNSASGARAPYTDAAETNRVAVYKDNSGKKTAIPGSKEANAAGLYDMSGNVWEWCFDRKDAISTGEIKDPIGGISGSRRILRGGGFHNGPDRVSVGDRHYSDITATSKGTGFRLAFYAK